MANQLEQLSEQKNSEELEYLNKMEQQTKMLKNRKNKEKKEEVTKHRNRRLKILNEFFLQSNFKFRKAFPKMKANKHLNFRDLCLNDFLFILDLPKEDK